jgi:hypothetical protein
MCNDYTYIYVVDPERKHRVLLVVTYSLSRKQGIGRMAKYMKHAYPLAILLVLLVMYLPTHAQCKWQITSYFYTCFCFDNYLFTCFGCCSFQC